MTTSDDTVNTVRWDTALTEKLLNVIAQTDGWRYALFHTTGVKRLQKGQTKCCVFKQIEMAMFGDDEVWRESRQAQGHIMLLGQEWVATSKWLLDTRRSPTYNRLLWQVVLQGQLEDAEVRDRFGAMPRAWTTWKDIPKPARKALKAAHPYYFIYMDLVTAPALYARLPAQPDIHTALKKLKPSDTIRRTARADPSDRKRKRDLYSSAEPDDADADDEEEEQDNTGDIQIEAAQSDFSKTTALAVSSVVATDTIRDNGERGTIVGSDSKSKNNEATIGSQLRPIELSDQMSDSSASSGDSQSSSPQADIKAESSAEDDPLSDTADRPTKQQNGAERQGVERSEIAYSAREHHPSQTATVSDIMNDSDFGRRQDARPSEIRHTTATAEIASNRLRGSALHRYLLSHPDPPRLPLAQMDAILRSAPAAAGSESDTTEISEAVARRVVSSPKARLLSAARMMIGAHSASPKVDGTAVLAGRKIVMSGDDGYAPGFVDNLRRVVSQYGGDVASNELCSGGRRDWIFLVDLANPIDDRRVTPMTCPRGDCTIRRLSLYLFLGYLDRKHRRVTDRLPIGAHDYTLMGTQTHHAAKAARPHHARRAARNAEAWLAYVAVGPASGKPARHQRIEDLLRIYANTNTRNIYGNIRVCIAMSGNDQRHLVTEVTALISQSGGTTHQGLNELVRGKPGVRRILVDSPHLPLSSVKSEHKGVTYYRQNLLEFLLDFDWGLRAGSGKTPGSARKSARNKRFRRSA